LPLPSFPDVHEARLDEGHLTPQKGFRLYWRRYTPLAGPRATVAVLPGGGDHGARYPGLTTALVRAGFEVALLNFRGHGRSGGRRFHVESYGDYLDDADTFLEHVRAGASGRKLFLVGHSQGGLIAALWMTAAPRSVAGVVLSSPFFRLKLRPPAVKVLAARALGRIIPWLPLATGLRSDQLTSDPEMQRWIDADPLYGRAATPRWFLESQRVQQEVLPRAPRFEAPLLTLLGMSDGIADPVAGRAFHDAVRSSDKELRTYEGFHHELFNERERERPIGDAVAWIGARST
jgi:alpha-beta hydrolase superfamily lysophospholipase